MLGRRRCLGLRFRCFQRTVSGASLAITAPIHTTISANNIIFICESVPAGFRRPMNREGSPLRIGRIAKTEELRHQSLPMDKDAVAEKVLKEIGVLLELKGRIRSRPAPSFNGARTLEGLTEPLETLIQEERLGEVKGIGKALVEKITELVETGELEYYTNLKASIPAGLIEMLNVQGMGPKKVKALPDKLGIESIEALEAACEAGQVAELDGFGKKSEEKILESIAFKRQHASHHHRHKMLIAAEPILDDLRSHPDVIRCDIAGSTARQRGERRR